MMLWLLNIFAYIINAVVVGVSTFGVLGRTNAEISDDYPTLITPDDWAFSIWGLIFLTELIFVVWGAWGDNRSSKILYEGVGCWFGLACILQAAWSVAFAQESLIASAVLLCGIAFSLGLSVASLSTFKSEAEVLYLSIPFWTVHFPIGLHGGWTLAAALVNITVALELESVSSEVAALILAIVGASFAAAVASIVFYDQVYLLAIAWAVGGIASKQDYRIERLEESINDGVTEGLNVLWIALLCVGVLGFISSMRQRNRHAHEMEEKGLTTRRAGGDEGATRAMFSS